MNRRNPTTPDSLDDRRVQPLAIFAEAAVGRGPDVSIPEIEKVGQQKLAAANDRLPKNGPWSELEKLGVVRGAAIGDLWYAATLPEGWKIVPSDHSMWSKLVDADGKTVAEIFYKAAFYDRDAFFHMAHD